MATTPKPERKESKQAAKIHGATETIKKGTKGGLRPGKTVMGSKGAVAGKLVDRKVNRTLSDKAGPSFKKKK